MHEMVFWNAGWLPVLLVSGVAFVVGVVLLARLVLQNKRREAPVARERSTVAQTAAPRRTVVDENIDQPPDPLPAQIGHYRIEKKLGRGAMGEVYLGRDGETGIPAAIKTLALSQAFAPDELADVRARFFREAETAGRLQHPDIVAILDAGEDGELAFIAMEFVAGSNLRPFTRPDSLLSFAEVASIGARIAEALACAHANNVVHRDVKPGNVMYDPATRQLRVMDFGVARLTDSSHTKTGMVLGTPSYMSPEQLLGKKVDGRSDLYSLGVMLYQLTCGQLPFVGQSMGQLMSRIANEACPDVRALNPQVPEALANVIERATRKDAAQRFPSGDEMARALRVCCAAAIDAGDEKL